MISIIHNVLTWEQKPVFYPRKGKEINDGIHLQTKSINSMVNVYKHANESI